MEKKVREMIGLFIDVYIKDDESMVYKICEKDDEIDELYKFLFNVVFNVIILDDSLIYKGI